MERGHSGVISDGPLQDARAAAVEAQGPEVRDEVPGVPLDERLRAADPPAPQLGDELFAHPAAEALPLVPRVDADDLDPRDLPAFAALPWPDVPDDEPGGLAVHLGHEADPLPRPQPADERHPPPAAGGPAGEA